MAHILVGHDRLDNCPAVQFRLARRNPRQPDRVVSAAMINDRRDDMTLAELVEELELSHPEKVAGCERR